MSRRKKTDLEMGPPPVTAAQITMGNPDRERVALRAYELYLERGRADGQAEEDWFTAERELGTGNRSSREA